MFPEKYHQRLKALFKDLERLEANPAGDSMAVRLELDALRARLLELETQFLENKNSFANIQGAETGSAAPIIYEKDRLGYVYAEDKIVPLQQLGDDARPNHDDKAITIPLTVSGQTLGSVQIDTPEQRAWTSGEIGLANEVVKQASLQIQNLRLLAATERARAEAETATHRFIHEGWASYLDAIHQDERIGFAYDQASVRPYVEKFPANSGFHEPMTVMDEQVGALYIKTDPSHPMTGDDKTLVAVVAHQLAQRVENLRLLADASRARAEAEEATRQLTRDSWQTYNEQQDKTSLSFKYDSIQVSPFEESSLPQDVTLTQPLLVRGEPVGQLVVAGWKNATSEGADLAAAIAAQASIHLETLRLNEELQKRAAELEVLDRLKSAFLANMSHELRTPLNSILGFSDVILEGLDGPVTEQMDNDLRLIGKNGQHLLHLINDVLDMAKIEAGRMNLQPEKFKLNGLFEEAINITSSLADAKSLSLVVKEDSDRTVEVFADRTRLQQVMINLINNGIKFTERGEVALRARQKDDHVLIEVHDTGIGIPPEQLQTIFQEFTQVDSSTTRKTGGTGLGLPISRRLIELHGGRLWAESTGISGEGSTFYVELPLIAKIDEPTEKKER